jgi:ferric-dicitrate binding protein FerR (iron transport regulator)
VSRADRFERYLAGALAAGEAGELKRLLGADAAARAGFVEALLEWQMLADAARQAEALPRPAGRRPGRAAAWAVAAAALLLAGVAAWGLFRKRDRAGTVPPPPVEMAGRILEGAGRYRAGQEFPYGAELAAAGGEKLAAELADGSALWLSGGARAAVPRRREVRLAAGELRLRCQADQANRFAIYAEGTTAAAVGTEFSVKVEEEDSADVLGPLTVEPPDSPREDRKMRSKLVTVVVIAGVVMVSNRHGTELAAAGEKLVSRPEARPAAAEAAEAVNAPESPLEKKLSFEFREKPVKDALDFVAKETGVRIAYGERVGPSGQAPITLKMNRATASLALDWICKLAGVDYYVKLEGDILVDVPPPPADLVYLGGYDFGENGVDEENPRDPKGRARRLKELLKPGEYARLAETIRAKVRPESWGQKGCAIQARDNGLTVYQTFAGHQAIRAIFDPLRAELTGKLNRQITEETRQALEPKLARKVTVEFAARPLVECIRWLQERTEANLIANPAAFGEGRVDPNLPITLSAKDISLGEALDKVLEQAGLRREFRNGAVFITAGEGAGGKPPAKPAPSGSQVRKQPAEVF